MVGFGGPHVTVVRPPLVIMIRHHHGDASTLPCREGTSLQRNSLLLRSVPETHGRKSRARDLDDARARLGPQLSAQVDAAAAEVSEAISVYLLLQKANGSFGLEDSGRPRVLAKAQALGAIPQRDDTISAA